MIFLSILICNCLSFGQWISHIPEESPQTINIDKGQILLLQYANLLENTLKISIPYVLSSPRYVYTKNGQFHSPFYFFYFNDPSAVELYFSNNISYYIDNANDQRRVSKICDFLLTNSSFNCKNYFKIHSNDVHKPFDTSRSYDKNSVRTEIIDFPSQPPHSLKVLSTKSLLSKSKIYIDIGNGKEELSTFYIAAKILPFKAKFYISYNVCSFYLMKELLVKNNMSLSFNSDDIPNQCFSYFVSISFDKYFPSDTLVRYQVNNDPVSEVMNHNTVYKFSKNSIFTVSFYLKNNVCNEYTMMKMVSVDDHFSMTNVTLFASDISIICLDSINEML